MLPYDIYDSFLINQKKSFASVVCGLQTTYVVYCIFVQGKMCFENLNVADDIYNYFIFTKLYVNNIADRKNMSNTKV